jgi:GTPase SAR1 family protein
MALFKNQLKVVFAGDVSVGKSTLLHRIQYGDFKSDLTATVGSQFCVLRRQTMQRNPVCVWDTTGAERFSHLLPIYFRGCHLLMLCFRVGDARSMAAARTIWSQAEASGQIDRVLLIATMADELVGNERALSIRQEALHSATRYFQMLTEDPDIVFIVSSKTGEGISDLVEKMYAVLERKAADGGSAVASAGFDNGLSGSRVNLDAPPSKKGCCTIQ